MCPPQARLYAVSESTLAVSKPPLLALEGHAALQTDARLAALERLWMNPDTPYTYTHDVLRAALRSLRDDFARVSQLTATATSTTTSSTAAAAPHQPTGHKSCPGNSKIQENNRERSKRCIGFMEGRRRLQVQGLYLRRYP